MRRTRPFAFFLAGCAASLVVAVALQAADAVPKGYSPYKKLNIFARVLTYVENNYVEYVDESKLPEIGKTLGRALGEFRRATSDLKRTLDTEMTAEEYRMPQPPGSSRLPRKPREPAEADGSSSDGRQTAEQATADEPATETGTEPG